MLYSLKELVFGLNEFEKAKIDDRINQAFLLVPKIKLERLEDFEILEENIYKLKEQLRIKSSNLNRVIKNSKLIPKKKVLQFIKDLEGIRYEFLKEVFSKYTPQNTANQTFESKTTNTISNNRTKIEEIKKEEKIELKSPISENNNKEKDSTKFILISENKFTLSLNNGIVPYISVIFKENFDLIILKNFTSIFFELYQMQGTNIIIENNTALIIPRFQEDNLINLPKIQENLDEIFKLMKNSLQNKTQLYENQNKENKIINKDPNINNSNQKDYLTINDSFKKQEFQTKKYDEDSLDILLKKHQENNKPKDEPNIIKPQTNTQEIKIESTESKLEIEHKEQIVKSEPEIQIIKQDDKKDLLEKHQDLANKNNSKPFQFEIYRDENIITYFKEDSKSIGTLCLTTPLGEPINTLSNESLSYLTIFSKVFAGVLFETIGCEGTNIIYNFSENTINIIPRIKDDNVVKMWNIQEQTPELTEKIKEQFLTTILIEQEKNKPKSQIIQQSVPKSALKEIEGETKSDKEKRAKHLLNSLRRIP